MTGWRAGDESVLMLTKCGHGSASSNKYEIVRACKSVFGVFLFVPSGLPSVSKSSEVVAIF